MHKVFYIAITMILIFTGCTQKAEQPKDANELKHFALDSMDGILANSAVKLDREKSADGGGSLKIVASEGIVVNLLEVRDIDVENARLLYQAKVSTKNLKGQVFLEMWVHLPGKGEFFTRNVHTPARGTTGWTTMEAPFFLKKGQNPDYVKLNLVIDGPGIAWIDDIRLVKGPLE